MRELLGVDCSSCSRGGTGTVTVIGKIQPNCHVLQGVREAALSVLCHADAGRSTTRSFACLCRVQQFLGLALLLEACIQGRGDCLRSLPSSMRSMSER